jgi:mRNA-degrading endonuclease RelE of RelBE toxin-antitoxin system
MYRVLLERAAERDLRRLPARLHDRMISAIQNLLDSLPGVLSDEDEGIAEALRRDAEMEADPGRAITLAELDSHIQSRRR